MKKKLTDIKKDVLEKELERLHVAVPPGPNVTKKILQQTLFTAILAKQTFYTEENDSTQPQEKSVGEKAKSTEDDDAYYLKGNWASFVTNIKDFIEVDGSIRDSW